MELIEDSEDLNHTRPMLENSAGNNYNSGNNYSKNYQDSQADLNSNQDEMDGDKEEISEQGGTETNSNQKDATNNNINDIFGSDSDNALSDLSDYEVEAPLPTFKRAPGAKPRKPRSKAPERSPRIQEEVSPGALRRREVQRDIDLALRNTKATAPRRNTLEDEVKLDEEAKALVTQMNSAFDIDTISFRSGMPGLERVRLLPVLKPVLSKISMHPSLLDAGVLSAIKMWLEPLSDGSLPMLDIQILLFEVLDGMQIDTENLEESLVGRIVMFYTKSPRITENIKKCAVSLIRRWMRPILKLSSNYRDLKSRPSSGSAFKKVSVLNLEQEDVPYVRMPQRLAPSFDHPPASNVSHSMAGEKKYDKFRKLKSTMKMMGRK